MKGQNESPGAGTHTEALGRDQLGGMIEPKANLATLQAQYLAEIFALSPDTAATIAFLAFGQVSS